MLIRSAPARWSTAGPARGSPWFRCAAGVYWLVRDSLIDDSDITLAYARNFAVHFHWGLIPQEMANSATSPLNVLLLAAVMAVLRVFSGALAQLFPRAGW
jgi:hypothetical protein